MLNLFRPKAPKENYFLSYRNIQANAQYPNYELARKLVNWLVQNRKCDGCTTVPPEAIPSGTLFTPLQRCEVSTSNVPILRSCRSFYHSEQRLLSQ
jgi:hypothetical protein